MRRTTITVSAALLLSAAVSILGSGKAEAAPTDAQKCAAAKMLAAAKYAACRLGADKKAELKNEPADYTKCDARQQTAWTKAETKYGAQCPTSGDQTSVRSAVSAVTVCLAGSVSTNGAAGAMQLDCVPCGDGGVILNGTCWILGAPGDSCTAACALEGMAYDAAADAYTWPSNGMGRCAYLMDLLGVPNGTQWFAVGQGPPQCGCSYGAQRYLGPDPITAQCAFGGLQRICACN